eukprot:TRINITY_DN40485_c0_g1_i1.p1 TRINITY_DN40485_c0_g1~~TRINITY_DN40485_c0_g1_i1.p1  ORF type:complete len:122 (-),score=48.07 TRINITY_DN40485_c0_g1_i1:140-505(-)
MLRSLVGSEMCIRDREMWRVKDMHQQRLEDLERDFNEQLQNLNAQLQYQTQYGASSGGGGGGVGRRRCVMSGGVGSVGGGGVVFFFQAEDGIRDAQESRGLGDVYKRQGDVACKGHAPTTS